MQTINLYEFKKQFSKAAPIQPSDLVNEDQEVNEVLEDQEDPNPDPDPTEAPCHTPALL
jgi:hypothetical protein